MVKHCNKTLLLLLLPMLLTGCGAWEDESDNTAPRTSNNLEIKISAQLVNYDLFTPESLHEAEATIYGLDKNIYTINEKGNAQAKSNTGILNNGETTLTTLNKDIEPNRYYVIQVSCPEEKAQYCELNTPLHAAVIGEDLFDTRKTWQVNILTELAYRQAFYFVSAGYRDAIEDSLEHSAKILMSSNEDIDNLIEVEPTYKNLLAWKAERTNASKAINRPTRINSLVAQFTEENTTDDSPQNKGLSIDDITSALNAYTDTAAIVPSDTDSDLGIYTWKDTAVILIGNELKIYNISDIYNLTALKTITLTDLNEPVTSPLITGTDSLAYIAAKDNHKTSIELYDLENSDHLNSVCLENFSPIKIERSGKYIVTLSKTTNNVTCSNECENECPQTNEDTGINDTILHIIPTSHLLSENESSLNLENISSHTVTLPSNPVDFSSTPTESSETLIAVTLQDNSLYLYNSEGKTLSSIENIPLESNATAKLTKNYLYILDETEKANIAIYSYTPYEPIFFQHETTFKTDPIFSKPSLEALGNTLFITYQNSGDTRVSHFKFNPKMSELKFISDITLPEDSKTTLTRGQESKGNLAIISKFIPEFTPEEGTESTEPQAAPEPTIEFSIISRNLLSDIEFDEFITGLSPRKLAVSNGNVRYNESSNTILTSTINLPHIDSAHELANLEVNNQILDLEAHADETYVIYTETDTENKSSRIFKKIASANSDPNNIMDLDNKCPGKASRFTITESGEFYFSIGKKTIERSYNQQCTTICDLTTDLTYPNDEPIKHVTGISKNTYQNQISVIDNNSLYIIKETGDSCVLESKTQLSEREFTNLTAIVTYGHYAYVIAGNADIYVIDTCDINNPKYFGTIPVKGRATDLSISDTTIYASTTRGVQKFKAIEINEQRECLKP